VLSISNKYYSQQDLLVSAAQHCPRIWKLELSSFKDFPEATIFPSLVDLTFRSSLPSELPSLTKNFLLQHNLRRLEITGVILDGKILKEILQGLPSLKHLKIYADKQQLTDIWPVLGNLETIDIRHEDELDKDIDKRELEFPKIP
jgi:hypothetical protein